MEGSEGRGRETCKRLISGANHYEQQRESPGWNISVQEERDNRKRRKRGRREMIGQKMEDKQVDFYKTSPATQRAETVKVEEIIVKGTAG